MKAEKTIRIQTRELLSKGNLPCCVGVTTVLLLALMTCIFLSAMLTEIVSFALEEAGIMVLSDIPLLYSALFFVLSVLGIVFSLPLFMGSVRFYYNLAKNEVVCFSDLFHYIQKGKFSSSILLMLRLILRNFWKALIAFLPGVLFYLTAAAAASDKENLDFYNILWYAISYAMIIGGVYLYSIFTSGSFLTLYLMTENENIPADIAISYSEYAMRGFEKSVHRILFLHLPLLVLCLAVIPILFVLPYIMTSYSISAKWIIQLATRQNEVE